MRILTRYVLREFLVPLIYCLIGFLSIYVLFDLFGSFSRMSAAKISVGTAVVYFCGYLAPYLHYIVPAALMLATLYTMWSFCRHSEIIAMRASGVSLLAIVLPLLSVALLLGLGVMWVNEVFVPAKAQWAAQMKAEQFDSDRIDRAVDVVYRDAQGARLWNIDSVHGDDGSELKNVRVIEGKTGEAQRSITAAQANYLDGEWWFSNPRIQHYDVNGQEIPSPVPELDALPLRCFPGFTETPRDFMMQSLPWKFYSTRDRLHYLKSHAELPDDRRRDCTYDLWAQLMAPWACLIITLFAIPAGIASGRQSVFKGILGALGMYFAFYGLTIVLMILAKNGLMPPIPAAVLPGVVFLGLGIRSFIRQR